MYFYNEVRGESEHAEKNGAPMEVTCSPTHTQLSTKKNNCSEMEICEYSLLSVNTGNQLPMHCHTLSSTFSYSTCHQQKTLQNQ